MQPHTARLMALLAGRSSQNSQENNRLIRWCTSPPLPGVWEPPECLAQLSRKRLDLCSSGTGEWRNPGTVSVGPFQGASLQGIQPRAAALLEVRFRKCSSPSGGDLPLKSTALPALGTGTLSRGDAGMEGDCLSQGTKNSQPSPPVPSGNVHADET